LAIADAAFLQPGIALIGYPRGEFGLGEALRNLALAAQSAALPFAVFDIDDGIWARQEDGSLAAHIARVLDRRINLLVQGPVDAAHTCSLLGRRALAGRYNILYAFWELPELPDSFLSPLAAFDEIWVPSRFVETAFASKLRKPVFRLPPPVRLPGVTPRMRSDFGLPDHPFLFHYAFDFSSYVERKHPEAVLAAFRRCTAAFEPGRIGLVLKTMGNSRSPAARRRLARLVDAQDDVFVIDGVLDRGDVLALQDMCDCFVSLHRSEGFGLGIVEAMALGKPVIATKFGGAADLLGPDHACPVGYRLVPVERGQYPGSSGQFWAEADVEEAAAFMRRMVKEPEWRRRIAAAGKAFVARDLSPERIGRLMSERLATTVAKQGLVS
jgi:glycosyltransferase involved in cell wall biosynthesis